MLHLVELMSNILIFILSHVLENVKKKVTCTINFNCHDEWYLLIHEQHKSQLILQLLQVWVV